MSWKKDLLAEVDKYCQLTGRARSGVGKMIMNDTKFFDGLDNGGGCTVDTYFKVRQWLRENTPRKRRPEGS